MHTNTFVLRFETNIAKPGPTLQTSTSTASLKGGHSNAELGYPTTGGGHKSSAVYCKCSKIMSPHNCNETLSPSKDGDDESERVPTSESDGECSGREADRPRTLPSAATE